MDVFYILGNGNPGKNSLYFETKTPKKFLILQKELPKPEKPEFFILFQKWL